MENKSTWDNFWERKGDLDIAKVIDNELLSVRWRKIEKRVIEQFGDFKNLEIIEIGCGAGTVSMLMASKGANVTLLDLSQTALDTAKAQFKQLDIKAEYILTDALSLPADLLESFDISMSFGLAEHFADSAREEIIRSHKNLLKKGGLSFISVPNAYCFPYRVYKKFSESAGLWEIGYEDPFTRSELRNLAQKAGYNEINLFGGSFLHDVNYFLFRNVKRVVINKTKGMPINNDLELKVKKEIPSILDDYIGYALVLVGYN